MSSGKPNFLLITSDQHHYMSMGINDPMVKTPNLDRLAEKGVVFTRAYTSNPTCTPARASIITGRYPSQHGAYSLGTKLPEDELTVGEVFSKHGYRTALVGKAHFQPLASTDEFSSLESYPVMQELEFWKGFKGPFYGFDHVELARNHTDEAHVGQHYALWMESKGAMDWPKYFQPPTGTSPAQQYRWNIPEELHYNTWIAERTNRLIEQYSQNSESFFVWASFFDPHPSYLVPEPWDTMYDPETIRVPEFSTDEHENNPPHFKLTQESHPDYSSYEEPGGNECHGFHSHLRDREDLAKDIAVYYGMISMMDKYIGKILDKLEACGLIEKTVVVFTTDHGHFLGQHGLIAKGPFHYEDMIRIPMICSQPGHIPVGTQNDSLQSLVDLAPTFLSMAGINVPARMTGVNQSDVWNGQKDSVRESVVVENRHQPFRMNAKTYVNRRYKITVYAGQTYGELFDLQEDPGELKNRWSDSDYAEVKTQLLLKLVHAEMAKEPLLMPRIAQA